MTIAAIPAELVPHLTDAHRYFYARAAAGWHAICQLLKKNTAREVVREVLLFLGGTADDPPAGESVLHLEIQWRGQTVAATYRLPHIMAALHYGAGVPWRVRENGHFLPAAEWSWNTWSEFAAHWPDDVAWPAWAEVMRVVPEERQIGTAPAARQPRPAPPEIEIACG